MSSSNRSTDMEMEMDGRIIMAALQQQKQEETHSRLAGAQFRHSLEVLVRDHLNTCMALASCSSSGSNSNNNNNSNNSNNSNSDEAEENETGFFPTHFSLTDEVEEIVNNSQLSEQEQERIGLESGASRVGRSDSILARWAAHHAEEMITTMEREAREAELLALTGLHAVSTLDSSFLTEQEPSRRSEARPDSEFSMEIPLRRASSLVQTWRQIEEERNRAELQNRMNIGPSTRSLSMTRNIVGDENRAIDPNTELNREQLSTEVSIERPRRASPLVQMWRAIEEERRRSGIRNRMGIGNVARDVLDSRFQPQESPNNIQQQITESHEAVEASNNQDSLIETNNSTHPDLVYINSSESLEEPNNEALDVSNSDVIDEVVSLATEGESEQRVQQIIQRLTSEGIMQENQSDTRSAWLGEDERERVRDLAQQWVRVSNQLNMENADHRQNPSRGRIISTETRQLIDQESILDLLLRIERERQRELEGLVEHHAVTEFAHRNRLRLLLRGRFLRSGVPNNEERLPSMAAGELGQLRERRAVTGMREGFRYRLERIVHGQANDGMQESQLNVQAQASRSGESLENSGARGSLAWQEFQRDNDFRSLEEATAYSMELQELVGRRSVTNVLTSDFRDRLDQLVRSYIETQGRAHMNWDFLPSRGNHTMTIPEEEEEEEEDLNNLERMADENSSATTEDLSPRTPPPTPPPPPPPLPVWPRPQQRQPPPPPPPPPPPRHHIPLRVQEPQRTAWSRPPPQRPSNMEDEVVHELMAENGRLQRKISNLQRMMETCIEMQLELQRSIRQEVSGALQQMYDGKDAFNKVFDGSKSVTVKKGICCVCCDKNIETLLYRCGHMCACMDCASELLHGDRKCPMCRAPIIEVVRAFTVG